MVSLMKPGESVAKALRRLGGGNKKMTSAQRLKAKKQGIKPTEEEIKMQESFQNLTSLADKLIQTGKRDSPESRQQFYYNGIGDRLAKQDGKDPLCVEMISIL